VSRQVIGHDRREGELRISAVDRKTMQLKPADVLDDGAEKTLRFCLVLKKQCILSHVILSAIGCILNDRYARKGWI
jgi:hypothetical protein